MYNINRHWYVYLLMNGCRRLFLLNLKSLPTGQAHVEDSQQHKKVFIYSMSAESINTVREDILHHLAQTFYTEMVPCLGVANFTEQQVCLRCDFYLIVNALSLFCVSHR